MPSQRIGCDTTVVLGTTSFIPTPGTAHRAAVHAHHQLAVPGPGIMFDMGGTPEADAVARELSWTSTVDFLTEHLR